MAVEAGEETTTLDGLTLRFCSSQCRATFVRAPERYLGASGARPNGRAGAGGSGSGAEVARP
jgi:YHS domain-containing protein